MTYQLRDGQGNLWPNERRTEDKHPNTTGKILIDGKLYYLAGWTKVTRDGKKWISLQAKEADEAAQLDPETGEPQGDDPGF